MNFLPAMRGPRPTSFIPAPTRALLPRPRSVLSHQVNLYPATNRPNSTTSFTAHEPSRDFFTRPCSFLPRQPSRCTATTFPRSVTFPTADRRAPPRPRPDGRRFARHYHARAPRTSSTRGCLGRFEAGMAAFFLFSISTRFLFFDHGVLEAEFSGGWLCGTYIDTL
jgi:hypothetical protein